MYPPTFKSLWPPSYSLLYFFLKSIFHHTLPVYNSMIHYTNSRPYILSATYRFRFNFSLIPFYLSTKRGRWSALYKFIHSFIHSFICTIVQTCGRSWRPDCDVSLQRLASSHLVYSSHAEQIVSYGGVSKSVYRHGPRVAVDDCRTLPHYRVYVLVFHHVRRDPRSTVIVRSVPVQQNRISGFLGSQATWRSRRLAC